MPERRTWCLSAGVDFVWREWDAEHVAYERFSGDLHHFDGVTAALLKALAAGARHEEALVDQIAGQLGLAPDADLASFVRQSLRQLSGLGLVEHDESRHCGE